MSTTSLPTIGVVIVTLAVLLAPARGQTILYVDKDAPPGGDGLSWDTAFDDLAEPLELATFDIVFKVAEGTYKPDSGTGLRFKSFQLKSAIVLEGGYAGVDEPDPNLRDLDLYETMLSGDLNGDDGPNFENIGDNSFHVIHGNQSPDSTAVLDGFTVIGGNADQAGGQAGEGGGLRVFEGSPTIVDCRFRSNVAIKGGGISLQSASGIIFVGCEFSGNLSFGHGFTYGGGAMFTSNTTLSLVDCRFESNISESSGGGIWLSEGSIASISRCVMIGNTAVNPGGAISAIQGTLNVVNTSFIGNESTKSQGGAVSSGSGTFVNCLFSGNYSETVGAAITKTSGTMMVQHCTFSANTTASHLGQAVFGSAIIENCILWDGGNEVNNATVSYSNVQFGWPGEGNISAIPLFADANGSDKIPGTEDDDLRLLPESPGIDSANSILVPLDEHDLDDDDDLKERLPIDLDGNPRFIDDPLTLDTGNGECPIIDMGAYEFQDGSEDCELAIASSEPPAEAIDARQPSAPDGSDVAGWSEVVLTFNGDTSGLLPEDFTIALDPRGTPPMIGSVFTEGNVATLQFGDFLPDYFPPGHWTIITHNASGSSVRLGYLPADVNNDRISNANDVLFLINVLNGVIDPAPPAYQTDTDRSGATNANDVLRVIDLLNGAGVYDEYLNAELPA